MKLDTAFLQELEYSLNTSNPEEGEIPINILGYGEISLVFTIPDDPAGNVAYKRLPIFTSKEQVEDYIRSYFTYNELLRKIGLVVPKAGATWVWADEDKKNITLFCSQEIIPVEKVGNQLIHTEDNHQIYELFTDVLDIIFKVFEFNDTEETIKIGFDAQISNFALVSSSLYYLDTSTPMFRINGEPAIDGELFLKSAPPIIRFFLKIFFLQEVLDRYYDPRSVIIDLLANFYKEQRSDLIPELIRLTNLKIKSAYNLDISYIKKEDVEKYYKSDKFIWVLFQKMRAFHRFITTKILRRKYPFYLPDKIDR